MKERIVLAFSGGHEASAAIAWLVGERRAEIVAVTLDLGQAGELEEIRDRALAAGAVRAHVLDVREEFARGYVLPALQAGALHEGEYPMAAALGRPLIAKKLVEIAAIEQAGAIAYGWRGRDGDRARIERAARALNPEIQVIAPPRRAAAPAGASGCCVDTNLWGRSIESGAIQDPWTEAPEDVFAITKAAPDAPNTPAHVEIAFEQGVPTAINGVPMALTELVESLTIIAGQHGVGRIDKIENRPDGVKSRVICEAPAAVVLHAAHGALRAFVSSRELERLTRAASVAYADLIHDGSWFTPMRAALDAFNVGVQQHVTGVVRMRLFKGLHTVVGRALPAQRAAADTAARTSQPVNNA